MTDQGDIRRDRMVTHQIAARGITEPRLLQALRTVPRERFVPGGLAAFAYDDSPLPIGEGQTISQPYIVALMIAAAVLTPKSKVLEVGAGSGYAAAVLSRLAAQVFAIERLPALAEAARRRLASLGYANVTVIAADGSTGLPAEAPFDAILVAARGSEPPAALQRQLVIGGRLIMPVGGAEEQVLRCLTRTGEEQWAGTDLGAVRFVPLIGAQALPDNA